MAEVVFQGFPHPLRVRLIDRADYANPCSIVFIDEPNISKTVAALAYCDVSKVGIDENARWTAVLQGIYRLREVQAHSFLAAINLSGLPNDSPSELLLRAHQHAKQLLPKKWLLM